MPNPKYSDNSQGVRLQSYATAHDATTGRARDSGWSEISKDALSKSMSHRSNAARTVQSVAIHVGDECACKGNFVSKLVKEPNQPSRLSRAQIALIVYAYEGLLRIGLKQGRARTVEMVKARMVARYKADPKGFARWKQHATKH